MGWKRYDSTMLEEWMRRAGATSRHINRLKSRGGLLSHSGIGYVGSKKDMEYFLEVAAEEGNLPPSVLRRLKHQARSSSMANESILGEQRRKNAARELYQSPSKVDIGKNRVQSLREETGQEHYLLKYKNLTPKERAKLESKRIQELAQQGQSWREHEYGTDEAEEDMKKADSVRHLQQRSTIQRRPTRLDNN